MAKKKEEKEEKVFDYGAYDRAMAHGDKHEVAMSKGWGKPEGESKDVVIAEE